MIELAALELGLHGSLSHPSLVLRGVCPDPVVEFLYRLFLLVHLPLQVLDLGGLQLSHLEGYLLDL